MLAGPLRPRPACLDSYQVLVITLQWHACIRQEAKRFQHVDDQSVISTTVSQALQEPDRELGWSLSVLDCIEDACEVLGARQVGGRQGHGQQCTPRQKHGKTLESPRSQLPALPSLPGGTSDLHK
jgi:hypothetical protein